MNDITSRFIEVYTYLLEQKKVSNPSHFAKMIDISTSMMNEILKGRSNAGINPIQNTVKVFAEINSEWLLIGNGNKLKTVEKDILSVGTKNDSEEIERLKDKIKDLQTINDLLTRTLDQQDKRNSNFQYPEQQTVLNMVAEPEPELTKKPKKDDAKK